MDLINIEDIAECSFYFLKGGCEYARTTGEN